MTRFIRRTFYLSLPTNASRLINQMDIERHKMSDKEIGNEKQAIKMKCQQRIEINTHVTLFAWRLCR